MPANLDSCVQQVLEKNPDLDESAAYAICNEAVGKVSSVSKTGQIATFTDNGRLYLKAFLLDASVNINDWGVTASSLKKNINTFIGKPLVLTEDYSHPVPTNEDSLDHWLTFQEDYRIGTIVDVVPKDSAYYALIEVTDPDAKRAIEQGAIPNYVSPAIAQLGFEASTRITNWTGVHLAIVDDPAFTVKKATITASCGGDSEQCLLQLRKAKIEKTGIRHGCGFCNYKALVALTSHTSSRDNFNLVKLEDNNTVNKNPDTSRAAQETNPPPPPDTTTMTATVPKTQYDELVKKLADAELKARELTETNKSISTQVAEIQLERRREKIERIITAELIKDDNKRTEKINTMVASSIPVKEIEDLYKDAFIVRKASIDSKPKPHVTIGSNDNDNNDRIEQGRKLATVAGVL